MATDPRDRPQYARLAERAPDRTPVQRANDEALEWAILSARLLAAVGTVAALGCAVAAVWTGDGRWWALAGLALLVALLIGWWGWWVNGNEGWRRG